jgi:hypothetical protein
VVSGDARIGIFGKNDEGDVRYASEGETTSIPVDCGHWIENMSDTTPLFILVLANEDV